MGSGGRMNSAFSNRARVGADQAKREDKRRRKSEQKRLVKLYRKFKITRNEFYESREWLEARYDILLKFRKCCLCGSAKRLHVDHIIPKSKLPPSRWLDRDNLQVLCEDCNLGKSNRDRTDLRSTASGSPAW